MTAAEHLELLARQDWESSMKDVFKEAARQFKVLKKNILDYQKEIKNAKKVAERDVKKAAAAAARAARAHGHITGNRGGRRGRGRGAAAASSVNVGTDDLDLDLELFRMTESSESSSNSDSESEADIPIPRSRRQCPVWVIQGHCEEASS